MTELFHRWRRDTSGRPAVVVAWLVISTLGVTYVLSLVSAASLENYLRDLSVNDTFYYYRIAENLAEGRFSTYDGKSLTNGHHPLWTWLLAPVFLLVRGTPEEMLPWLKAWELSLLTISVGLFAVSLRVARGLPWLAAGVLGAAFGARGLTVGMEGVAVALAIAAVLAAVPSAVSAPEQPRRWLLAALGLAALPYARLELLIVTVVALGAILVYCRATGMRPTLRPYVFCGLTLVPVALYFLGNWLIFGSALPVSGLLKQDWSRAIWQGHGGYDFVANLRAVIAVESQRERMAIGLALVLVPVLSWLNPKHRRLDRRAEHGLDMVMLALGFGAWARFAYTVLAVAPQFSSYSWYFAAEQFCSALLPALVVHRLLGAVNDHFTRVSRVALWAAVLWTGTRPTGPDVSLLRGRVEIDWEVADYHSVLWMRSNLPKDAIVGSTDSGVFSFFTRFRVINLDGLVNSTEFRNRQRERTLGAWAGSAGIRYLANSVPRTGADDGCTVMAHRMRQPAPLPGKCTVLLAGTRFGDRQSMVWRYDPE